MSDKQMRKLRRESDRLKKDVYEDIIRKNFERHRPKILCRLGHIVEVPCNWVVNGWCGEDSHPCVILKLIES